MTPVRLEPAALRARVKHSNTERLCSPRSKWNHASIFLLKYESLLLYMFKFVFIMLLCLFLAALWSPEGKGLPSWLSCVWCFLCDFVTFPYGVKCKLWYLIVLIPGHCLLTFCYEVQELVSVRTLVFDLSGQVGLQKPNPEVSCKIPRQTDAHRIGNNRKRS